MIDLLAKLNPVAYVIITTIVAILVLTFGLSISVRNVYRNLMNDLKDARHRDERKFRSSMLNAIVGDYQDTLESRVEEINTAALIEKHIHLHLHREIISERFVNKSSGLMIVLGLLGTFYGLTLAIGDIVQLLTTTGDAIVSDAGTITDGLISSIRGMSVAFVTSLFGIAASIVVHLVSVLFHLGEARDTLIVHCEEYLDNIMGPRSANLADADENGNTVLELAFRELSDKLNVSLTTLTGELTQALSTSTAELVSTTDAIQGSVSQFDSSLQSFAENTRDFSEFNHHLRSNIQRLSLTFDDHANQIKQQTQVLKDSQKSVDEFNRKIDQLSHKNDKR
jgi:methyl-accepting chemotaxis protein